MINLLDISGHGFMSFKSPFSLIVEQYVGRTVQIDGENKDDQYSVSNGSGKSTLIEAISWAWYGSICRKNKYNDEVINKKSASAVVSSHFIKDGCTYLTTRTIHRKKEPKLVVLKDGVDLFKGATSKTIQVELEKILGMGFTAFQCCCLFGSNFMNFPDLKPNERAKVLTDIRGLDKYLDASKKANDTSKQLGIIVQELSNKLQKEEGRLAGVRSQSYREDITRWEQEREKFITDKECDILSYAQAMEELEQTIQDQISPLEAQIKAETEKLKGLKDGDLNLKEAEDNMHNIMNQLARSNGVLSTRQARIREQKEKIEEFSERGEGECPYCGQQITGEHLKTHIKELKKENKAYEEDERLLREVTIKGIQTDLTKAKQKVAEIKVALEEISKAETLISECKTEIAEIKADNDVSAYKAHIEELNTAIAAKQKEVNPYVKKEEERKVLIKQIGATIRGVQNQITETQSEQAYYIPWVDGFKKIRMNLFQTMIDELENTIQEYLSQYSSELSVILSTEKETRSGTLKDEFHIGVIDADGVEMSYEMYSGGEKQKVRLSIARALAQFIRNSCGVEFNFIAFDEPNDALDEAGKETNFETFQELADEGKAVLVTDHDSNFKDKFHYNILVVKEEGESHISNG